MSTIKFGDSELTVLPIPAYMSEFSEEQIEMFLIMVHGNAARVVTTEDGQRKATWVVPPIPKQL